MAFHMEAGVPQANGEIRSEPMMDLKHVVDSIIQIAELPNSVTVLHMNIMFVFLRVSSTILIFFSLITFLIGQQECLSLVVDKGETGDWHSHRRYIDYQPKKVSSESIDVLL